jgi:uncharacterized protein YkvS
MNRLHLLISIFVITIFLLPHSILSQEKTNKNFRTDLFISSESQVWSDAEQVLWNLEMAYMSSYKDKRIDELASFAHKKFIGWPNWSTKPLNISEAKTALEKSSDTHIKLFKIWPEAMVMHDKIAIVHYFIDLELENKAMEKLTASFRIIHTWIQENGIWKILGGMSAI